MEPLPESPEDTVLSSSRCRVGLLEESDYWQQPRFSAASFYALCSKMNASLDASVFDLQSVQILICLSQAGKTLIWSSVVPARQPLRMTHSLAPVPNLCRPSACKAVARHPCRLHVVMCSKNSYSLSRTAAGP